MIGCEEEGMEGIEDCMKKPYEHTVCCLLLSMMDSKSAYITMGAGNCFWCEVKESLVLGGGISTRCGLVGSQS